MLVSVAYFPVTTEKKNNKTLSANIHLSEVNNRNPKKGVKYVQS